ncbi:glutamate--tRNA ligase [Altererythrobacter sp.]|uniref:glutamate--tRNA ligase n=1 Tax=Altererythrobacter sp. TaxID=1872480 RepID=UPI001B1FFCD8|nr:glutamate--tRNA ligase [Altererythrobacter sp.]MBO6608271.1 glutamate--tRNA ligase [Altererythrobacter sp.]MBO6641473.1 glutamate--tRNA ligase [Altererythrobacter sp.]MBO6707828.1 glutamate--tRNA ligase [Altererythrobacter sp.]MBO6946040.1 glutamate--tRNA ligase [Altererythrobacter sp.]
MASESGARTGRVVTRFAPSPTGFLHIGGARTALFNWLYARHHGGKALLRIEDTDKSRSTQEAIDAILDGLDWLGLDYDEEPVFQSQRAERHAEVALKMLEAGYAYKCFATPEELEVMRAEQRANKQPMRYDGRWRDRDASEAPEGAPYTIRIKTRTEGETSIEDAVQGHVTVRNEEIDDYIILRADGSPTYMLAVVVDDYDMGVTHVIRGDDHLNNAFRQLPIYHAMQAIEGGWEPPVYAHVPLIHGSDGTKMSKRHGSLGAEAYRDDHGILPEALFNYLLRLGWGHGDREEISREEAIELFDLKGVGKSPSRFDMKKLENLNGYYIREADDARLAQIVAPLIEGAVDLELLTRAMPVLKVRAKSTHELAEGAAFLFKQRPLEMSEKAANLLDEEARERLGLLSARLAAENDWTIDALEATTKSLAEELELGLGKLAQPLRAALTGTTTSPGIFDVLVLLGREEALARIDAQAAAAG